MGDGVKVLVACEYSGRVRDAFIARGHDAMSCDLLPTEAPGPHYQGDVRDVISDGWDLMVAHPPCTYLTIAAEWAYKDVQTKRIKPGTLIGAARRQAREEAVEFVMLLANAGIPRICIENPVGVLSSRWRKPDQIVQPWQFGHDVSKATCLWLKGLPPLMPTKHISGRIVGEDKRGMTIVRWGNQTDSGQNKLPPTADRWKLRSTTYAGIAEAMADQWGDGFRLVAA